MIHILKHMSGRRGRMMIKINLEKAYDRLEWHFIKETLLYVGLPHAMVDIIMECISKESCWLLWNGECVDRIEYLRGICHGDPLSPTSLCSA